MPEAATQSLLRNGAAVFSPCQRYRYRLERVVGRGSRTVTFGMLNPSTADAEIDDPTIRRCMGFARLWGCARLIVVNVFAFRATDPAAMVAAADPIGPENDAHILKAALESTNQDDTPLTGAFVCAWGVHGAHRGRDRAVLGMLRAAGVAPLCLGTTKDGFPKHPLYIRADQAPTPYEGRP